MANSKIPNVDLTDTFNTNRVRFNNLLDSVGDVSTLTTSATDVTSAINEHDAELGTITSGAMGTTAGTVSGAIAELDDRLDSINNTQIQSAKLLMNDSSAVSAIKGKLDVHGDLYAGGILYTDQIKSASASEQVFINDTLELQANDINDVANIHLRTALIHDGDTNTKLEFGTDTIDLHTGGTARVAITNNDVTISENLTVQDSAYVTGNLAVGGNTTIGGTLTVDGEVTFKAGANSNINLGDGDGDNVVFNADVNSSIIPNTDNTYDLGSSTKEWRHGYFDGTVNADNLAADSATLGTVKVTDLTAGRIVTVGTNGEVQDDADLTYSPTTDTLSVSNIDIGTQADLASAKVEDLTNNRIVIAGTGGELEDDANLTFDGTTLAATAAVDITGDLDVDNININGNTVTSTNTNGAINITPDGTGEVVISTATVSDLTNNRIVIAGTSGELEDDANLTFDGTTFSATAAVDITGDLDVDNININGNTVTSTNTNGAINITPAGTGEVVISTATVSDLTDNRIIVAGTSGALEDDANLTFDGTTFEVGTKFDVSVTTGNTNIDGDLDVDGTTDLDDTNVDGDLDVTGSFTTITTNGLTEGDNLYYTTARADSDAKNSVSATDAGGDGSFTYNNATGVFTYTGPSASDVRAHITAGEGIDFSSGVISGEDATTSNKGIASFNTDNFSVSSGAVSIKDNGITLGTETTGNYVATIAGTANEITVSGSGSETAAVTVGLPDDVIIGNNLTVTNDFTVGGSFTVAGEQRIAAQYIFLQDGTTGTPILNSGITVDRGSEDSAVFQWNETSDYWEAGTKNSLNRFALQDDSANFTSLSVNNDLVVSGNLDIRGTTTTIDTTNLTIEDNLIILNGNQTGTPSTTLRSGLEIERGDASNAKFQFNENTDEWEFTGPKTGTLAVTGDIGNATITLTAGTDLSTGGNFTTNQSGNETITINHADITRVDTTSTDTPGYGGTFEAVTGVTTNARGHVTAIDVSTVTIPASDNTDTIYTHPTHDGDDINIDTGALTGATVISDLDFNVTTDSLGHVTDANGTIATRTLTLADLGYTGATDANNYSLPEATSTVRGGIELFSNTDQSVAANAVTTTAGRTYGLQLNSDGQGVINVPWTGAEPVNTIDSDSVTLLQTLDNPNVYGTTAIDRFGRSVAADGKYLAISAPGEDTASFSATGVVYVHNILNGSLLHIIQDPNPGASNSFGVGGSTTEIRALDISGNWLIAGSSLYDSDGDNNTGIAYIFNLMTGALHKTLANPNGYSTPAGDYFGANVAIDGHYAAVSAIGEDDALGLGSGKVYIFNAVTGALLHTLDNPHTGGATSSDEFGHGLSLSGKYLLVGAPGNGNFVGKAYIYNVITGGLIATIDNPNAVSTADNDNFGFDVSIDGNYAAISATGEDRGSSTSVGWVYIFKTTNGTWSDVSLLHSIVNPGAFPYQSDIFGRSVSISGDYGIFTAYLDDDDGSTNSGKAYIYNLTAGGLVSTLDNPNAFGTGVSDYFGYSATISGNYAAVGAMEEDDSDGTSSGKVYTYSLVDPTSTSYVTYAELNNLG